MSVDKRAFALREDAKESFSSAAVAVAGEGEEIRVEDLIAKRKDGVIVVDAGPRADALGHVEALKEVPVPSKSSASADRKEA